MSDLHLFMYGAVAALSGVATLFFLRYWHDTRDRFFLWFALAFAVFGASWAAVAASTPLSEGRQWIYVLRLVGFLVILGAIVGKNRSSRP